nr:hypothetical protein BaRGS_018250 [Batillaria attramentaria]
MIDKYQGDVAYVQFNGTVSVWAYLTLDVISKMELTAYPFDTQRCRVIVFISSTNPVNSKHVEDPTLTGNATRQLFAVGAEWTFEGQTVEEKELPGLGQYTIVYLEYTWTITRKTTYFVISFIVPIVLTSYMNTVVFVIPVESGERISYLVTIFVSTAVLVSFCTVNVMPQGGVECGRVPQFETT